MILHTVICIDGLVFRDLKPLYYLVNPKYYSHVVTPTYELSRQLRFLLCKVVLNNLEYTEHDQELKDEFFWSQLVDEANTSDERAVVVRILTRLKLERGNDEWAYRFIPSTLHEDSELNEMLATLDFLASELTIKGKEYIKMMMEKYRIDLQLEVLQKKKSSAVYVKV